MHGLNISFALACSRVRGALLLSQDELLERVTKHLEDGA